MHRLAHPDGELATSRAAAKMNVCMGLSSYSTESLENVAAQGCGNPYVMQMCVLKDRSITLQLLQRAEGMIHRHTWFCAFYLRATKLSSSRWMFQYWACVSTSTEISSSFPRTWVGRTFCQKESMTWAEGMITVLWCSMSLYYTWNSHTYRRQPRVGNRHSMAEGAHEDANMAERR
ncbi:FMN-dependent dehydrogenase [Macrophomina phaseolina MS6]|uniref:FMN-dependent dehydrogenase n=1 Tax=Macrophomina phaseolina (strain MS6) TaxID=1126212 RepID=K2RNT7_MACPH|nr:FMN-dependent dehydrogenase [Macrophomina phaseolina MS6]